MKNLLIVFIVLSLFFLSCTSTDESVTKSYPTSQEFKSLFEAQLIDKTQEFTFDASINPITITTNKGVDIVLYTSCLSLGGNPVTGECILKVVEIFDKGAMLVTNKPSYGIDENGNRSMLISAGEFNIEAFKDGELLETCGYGVLVPGELSNGINNEMTLWNEVTNDSLDFAWEENIIDNGEPNIEFGDVDYLCFFGNFGWTNLDIFYLDQNPKTTLLVDPPNGYDNLNSKVFLSYIGEPNALATLDVYNDQDYFSEHYGQLPIGIEVNLIFVSEVDENFTYAIKTVLIEEDQIYSFSENELQVATASQLEAVVRSLP